MDTKRHTVQAEIDRMLDLMKEMSIGSKEYKLAAENLAILLETKNKSTVSRDVIVGGAINILGILLVLNYEHLGVVTSKAFSMIRKS